MVADREPLVIGDLFDGAYGPTLLLEAQNLAGVDWFRRQLVRLARDESADFDLASMSEIEMSNAGALRVRTAETQPEPAMTRLGGTRSNLPDLDWRQDSLRWIHAAMLVEALLKGNPGHQYLTNEKRDDVLVEFSHGENLRLGSRSL